MKGKRIVSKHKLLHHKCKDILKEISSVGLASRSTTQRPLEDGPEMQLMRVNHKVTKQNSVILEEICLMSCKFKATQQATNKERATNVVAFMERWCMEGTTNESKRKLTSKSTNCCLLVLIRTPSSKQSIRIGEKLDL